ncbi:MAG: PPE domain-containing protein [Actinophytocola sp.]|uniref:PPE domain-containing protein n=1 Tax=Actinophytocola sp. TaxID=1872138 RepID=UPI003C7102EF
MAERRKAERYGIVDNGSVVSGLKGSDDGVFWEGYSHQEMWGMIMRSEPSKLFERVDQWQRVAAKLEERNVQLQTELNNLLKTWQGPAAAAAAASQQKLLTWAQDAATRASTISTQLADYGNALVDARMRMPQPQHRQAELGFRDDEGATVQDGTVGAYKLLQLNSDRLPTEQQRREAKNEAVRVMQRLEKDADTAERAMPRFSPAPPVTVAPDPAPPARPAPANPAIPDAPQDPGPQTPPGMGSPGFASGAPTAPSAVSFDAPGTGLGPGAPESGGRPSYGDGRFGPPGNGPLGAGPFRGETGVLGERPVAGVGPVTQSVGASGMPGRPGNGGHAPGVMPGSAGTRGDEDKEKPLADYLDGPDDVFSVDQPAYPPVLGT